MRRHLSVVCLSLAMGFALVSLSACGKKGAPEAPGPADKVIYPRSYPAPD